MEKPRQGAAACGFHVRDTRQQNCWPVEGIARLDGREFVSIFHLPMVRRARYGRGHYRNWGHCVPLRPGNEILPNHTGGSGCNESTGQVELPALFHTRVAPSAVFGPIRREFSHKRPSAKNRIVRKSKSNFHACPAERQMSLSPPSKSLLHQPDLK